ncbi:MAG: RNA polymerase sigma factor [Bacillota bacterium]|nr:RNA polymerase sigma factor [Bacillota bacterium]
MNAIQLDENLILRMADGDGIAYRELYQKTSSAVYGFALSILNNRFDAEDVMHDTYIKAYTGAATYKPMGKPLAWILTIVRNLSYSKIRSGKVCEDIGEYEGLMSTDDTDRNTDRMVLEKAMDILAFEERQIVILHALTGLKHREIAEILDVPTGTVLSKYNRALKKMKKELEGRREIV